MEQVAPRVYVESGYASGNVGFIVTGSGVVCIDVPMLPEDVRHWRAQIESVTDEPMLLLVQTDYDQERVVGTYWLDAPIVRVAGLDSPIPYSIVLEDAVIPNEKRIMEAVRKLLA